MTPNYAYTVRFVPQIKQQREEKLKNWDNDFYIVGSLDTDHEKYQAASGRAREKYTKTKVPQTFNIAAPGNKAVKQKSMQKYHDYHRTRDMKNRPVEEDKGQTAQGPARRRPQTAPAGGRAASTASESDNQQPAAGSGSTPSLLSTPNRGASDYAPESPLMSPHLSPAPPPGMVPLTAGTQGTGVTVGAGAQAQQPRLVSQDGVQAQAQAQTQGRSRTPLRRAADDGAFDLDPEVGSTDPLSSTDMRLIDELAGIAGDMYYLNR